MPLRVDLKVAELENLLPICLLRTAQHRLDACHQRHHAKGLCHIVVCTAVQSDDLIVLRTLCGDHNHRQIFCCHVAPNLFQNFQTVLLRQHDIQQNQIRLLLCHRRPERRGHCKPLCLHSGAVQGIDHQFPNAVVVFYQINHIVLPFF